MRFLNFNVESDCVPTRSALMTPPSIRTGGLQSVPAALPQYTHGRSARTAEIVGKDQYDVRQPGIG